MISFIMRWKECMDLELLKIKVIKLNVIKFNKIGVRKINLIILCYFCWKCESIMYI